MFAYKNLSKFHQFYGKYELIISRCKTMVNFNNLFITTKLSNYFVMGVYLFYFYIDIFSLLCFTYDSISIFHCRIITILWTSLLKGILQTGNSYSMNVGFK